MHAKWANQGPFVAFLWRPLDTLRRTSRLTRGKTFHEFRDAVAAWRVVNVEFAARAEIYIRTMDRMGLFIRSNHELVGTTFRRFDKNGTGFLEPWELSKLVREVMPWAGPTEVRYVLTSLQRSDKNGDGCASFP